MQEWDCLRIRTACKRKYCPRFGRLAWVKIGGGRCEGCSQGQKRNVEEGVHFVGFVRETSGYDFRGLTESNRLMVSLIQYRGREINI
jgi:hypothetical protein